MGLVIFNQVYLSCLGSGSVFMEEKSVSPVYHSDARSGPHASNSFFASRDFDPWTEDLSADGFPDKKESWAVSWSDLMMTMFVLFAVLYVYQAGNR